MQNVGSDPTFGLYCYGSDPESFSCRWWVIELAEKKEALQTKEMLETYIKSSLRRK